MIIDDKLRRNIVKVAVEPRAAGGGSAVNFDIVMAKFKDRRIKN